MKRFEKAAPVVKWVGGKRQLLPVLTELLPKEPIITYCEPFVGGGALLFHLQPEIALINDINGELMNAYNVIKNDVDALIAALSQMENTSDFYYKIRCVDRYRMVYAAMTDVDRAARFIYLNKTCYNGLYRVNQRGEFNAPYGKYKNPNIVNAEVLYAVRDYLNHALIYFYNMDFGRMMQEIPPNAFVYLDPPYMPSPESKNFTGYTKDGFTLYDQIRLRSCCDELHNRGIKFMLSNSNTPAITSLYGCYVIDYVQARRAINCKGDGRGEVTEVVVRNYL